jgi:hypothetical protein
MRTRSSAVTQDALSARLNVILSRNFHCVLDNPKKVPQKVSPRKLRIRRPLQMGTPYGDPYKYSEYPETAHYIDPPQPGIFNDVVGDGYFDDDEDDEQGFRFEDLIPVLEDDSDDYDPEADYNRYADEAGYRDEGEADPPVPPQPPRPGEEIQPPVLRLTPPADQRRRITTPRRPLPDEGGEEDGAAGGEAWQTPASIDAQREFYSALLDEVDNYTRAAENTQRTLRSLGSAQQQERIKAEIRKRAQELQEQLEWADKNLDQRAISDAKLERAFRPAPAPPPRDGRGSRRRPPDPGSPDSSPPRPVTRSQKK